jgi:hypothetical protein
MCHPTLAGGIAVMGAISSLTFGVFAHLSTSVFVYDTEAAGITTHTEAGLWQVCVDIGTAENPKEFDTECSEYSDFSEFRLLQQSSTPCARSLIAH